MSLSHTPGVSPLLAVRDLAVGIPGRPALVKGINFTLNQGQVLGIAGQSGSGKTLTASAIAGLLPRPLGILGGKITFGGRPLYAGSPPKYGACRGREILFLFQSPLGALDPCVRTGVQVSDALKCGLGIPPARARDKAFGVLERAGLSGAVFHRYPFELSGGQRQRVLMAMAFGLKPGLIIADEPTAGQDDGNRDNLMALMGEVVKDTGTAAILISHDLRVLSRLAGSIAVLYQGKQVESGPPLRLFSDPVHSHTRALVRAMAYLEGRE